MGIGGSIALLVIGAILAFAVRDTTLGGVLDINVVGWILLVVGILGLVMSMIFWSSWGGWGGRTRRETVVRDDYVP